MHLFCFELTSKAVDIGTAIFMFFKTGIRQIYYIHPWELTWTPTIPIVEGFFPLGLGSVSLDLLPQIPAIGGPLAVIFRVTTGEITPLIAILNAITPVTNL